MFIGHFGADFAGKNFEKSASLETYFIAAQWIDLIWSALLLLGIEKVEKTRYYYCYSLRFYYYPFSHCLFGVTVCPVLFGMVYFLIQKK